MFRQLTDIYDSWGSVIGMIDYFGDDPGTFSQVAAPGAWNDPDQVDLYIIRVRILTMYKHVLSLKRSR